MQTADKVLTLKARKKLKIQRLKVGDFVQIDENLGVIEQILPRKNELVRPPVANVEQVLILVATVPKPDFLLVDKLLIKYFSLGIEPVIVVNKMDLADAESLLQTMRTQYGQVAEVLGVTTKNGITGLGNLPEILAGKFSLLTGQSAVGKTSLLNVLLPDRAMQVGEMSAKAERGKNTTRHSEIFVLPNGGLIADSPGFNAFELENFTPEDIIDYTLELKNFSDDCKYNDCNHIGEDESICAVKRAVAEGAFDKERYARFCELFAIAKKMEDKKYE